jgi:hypothetical protein
MKPKRHTRQGVKDELNGHDGVCFSWKWMKRVQSAGKRKQQESASLIVTTTGQTKTIASFSQHTNSTT